MSLMIIDNRIVLIEQLQNKRDKHDSYNNIELKDCIKPTVLVKTSLTIEQMSLILNMQTFKTAKAKDLINIYCKYIELIIFEIKL